MFKHKKIGQLSLRKDIRIPLDSDDDMVTFFNDKETEKAIKDYDICYIRNNPLKTIMSCSLDLNDLYAHILCSGYDNLFISNYYIL